MVRTQYVHGRGDIRYIEHPDDFYRLVRDLMPGQEVQVRVQTSLCSAVRMWVRQVGGMSFYTHPSDRGDLYITADLKKLVG